jgi:hypothetical protein
LSASFYCRGASVTNPHEALPITVRHGVIDKSNEAVEIDSIDELPPTIGDVFVALG